MMESRAFTRARQDSMETVMAIEARRVNLGAT